MAPLVSILIPAYNERFFGEAFASALAQHYAPLEILICDDSPGSAIGASVQRAADPRVRYVRNPKRLGFGANFTQCFSLARGELVKFLNDDDRLRPGCVATLAGALQANSGVRLATSRRLPIDDTGKRLADVAGTLPIALVSALMHGRALGDLVLEHSLNLIGEPTTVMFRRASLELEDGAIFRWGGRDYHCLADLSVWLRLLGDGLAYYAAAPLSEFRIHVGQEQEKLRVACLVERLWILREAQSVGFLASPYQRQKALATLRARIVPCFQVADLTGQERVELEELLAAVDGDIARVR